MSIRPYPVRCATFDIGGTNLRAGRYDPHQDKVVQVVHRSAPNHLALPECSLAELRDLLFSTLDEMLLSLLGHDRPDLVGLAFPGPIDPSGNVLSVPTLFGVAACEPLPIAFELRKRWPGVEVAVMNDVSAAGYYYLRRPDESFCITTVSSGVGNKIFIDGRPFVGPNGRGGEIGHIVVDSSPQAAPCDCGGRGHLGGIASGRGALQAMRAAARQDGGRFQNSALGRLTLGSIDAIDNEGIVEAFCEQDAWVTEQIRRITSYLARVLASIHTAIGIERFVIMGGFALALGEPYRYMLAELCADNCWNLGQDWQLMIQLATTGDEAALIGTGRAAMQLWEAKT